MDTYHVVVGVDGTEAGERALRWAARQTADHGGIVRAVIAWQEDGNEAGVPAATSAAAERRRAQEIIDRAVRIIAAEFPDLIVASEVVEGPPVWALARAAHHANMLVLGSHGHGRLRHAVLGSVSDECVRMAGCPVVIIPAPRAAGLPCPADLTGRGAG